MNRIRYVLAVCAVVSLLQAVWGGEAPTNDTLRVAVDLSDGSRIIGIPRLSAVPVETTYAKIRIPLREILTVVIDGDHKHASFTLGNGDRLQGVLTTEPLELNTIFGKVSLPIEHVKGFRVDKGAGASLTPELKKGLILYYTFDRDEGGTVTDASGNGRTAKIDGATWVAAGARGGAVRFDNNNQSIRATDAGLPSGNAPRSIALWMKLDKEYPEGVTGMFGYGTQGMDARFSGLGFDWRLDRDRVCFSPGGTCFLTERKLPKPGTWMHVVYTYGGNSDHHLYMDGVLSDGMSELGGAVNTTLSGLLLLGGHPGDSGLDGGYLDEVMIYDRALTKEEISKLYESMK